MDFKEPQSRNEAILQNILGAMNELLPPESRVEAILQSILYETSYELAPQSRIEELLLAIKNGGTFDDEARSRNEAILLAKLNGEEYTEAPQSRIEELLIEWANVPSWVLKTVSGSVVSIDDAIAAPAEELTADIVAWQEGSGDPAPDNERPIHGFDKVQITNSPVYPIEITNNAPYLLRQSGGMDISDRDRENDSLVGASAVVNQAMKSLAIGNGYDTGYSHTSSITYSDGTLIDTANSGFDVNYVTDIIATHKYLVSVDLKCSINKNLLFRTLSSTAAVTTISLIADTRSVSSFVFASSNNANRVQLMASSTQDSVLTIYSWQMFDLTALFGTTIADYVYSLEQATAGSGIAYLRKYGFFTKDYYPYQSNALQSVKTSAHIMRDSSDNIIGNYGLPDVELRGIYKKDASNNLYADGDTLDGDGTLTRKYGIVDLGNLVWTKTALTNKDAFSTDYRSWNAIPLQNFNSPTNAVSQAFVKVTYQTASVWNIGEAVFTASAGVLPRNSFGIIVDQNKYADAEAFKTAMSGVYLVYELATPTTETTTGFTNPQIVDENGTEEYVDTRDFALPVGHTTAYFNSKMVVTSVNLGNTYYGGVLDVTSGVMTVTQEVKVCNGSSSDGNWTIGNLYGTSRRFNLSANYFEKGLPISNCNYLNPTTNVVNNAESIVAHTSQDLIICLIHTDRLSEDSLNGWNEYLSNKNLIFVYPLNEPFDVQLTPTEVNLLANQVNTIFADTGDISLTYKAKAGD